MADSPFRSFLLSKDFQKAKAHLHAINLQENLIPILNDLLFTSIKVNQSPDMTLHPVCVLNSIKNILGDDRNNPSITLLEFGMNYLMEFDFRENDQSSLDVAAKDGIGLTAFLGDLEDACQQGKRDEAELITAKTFLASDSSRGVMDSLCELALQDSKRNSLFIFHFLRAYQFQELKEDNWAYTACVFDWMQQSTLPVPHDEVPIQPENIFDNIVKGGDLNWFGAVTRLWEGDYVRIRSYQRELSYGLSQAVSLEQDVGPIENHWLNSDEPTKFIEATEKIVSANNSKSDRADKIVILESVRALSRKASLEQKHILAARLDAHL